MMSVNKCNAYDIDSHIAEIYDQFVTERDDVELVRDLISDKGRLRILEPFCGTGRLLIPLALDGHELVGVDQARAMLDRARAKIRQVPEDVQRRITLIQADVTASPWPKDFDLVILGGNCFYELATPEEQEGCILSAASALKAGGYLYLDNNHMEGELDESWQRPGKGKAPFPNGICADGVLVEGFTETIWYDGPKRLWRCRRTVKLTHPDGTVATKEWVQQKHPPSTDEMRGWLERRGFAIEHLYGDRELNPYNPESPRAIFWARKGKGS
jgi:SAM-dependent methyltransferase